MGVLLRHNVAEQDLARLLVGGADDARVQKVTLLRPERGNSVLDENGISHLDSLFQTHRPALVVLDPLVALCGGGDVNDNAVMALVMRALKGLANKHDCAVLIVHHTRKGGDLSTAEAISGASAIVNLARGALMTLPMTEAEAKPLGVLPSQRFRYFKVVASKSNLAPRSDETPWYELDTVELPNPEPPAYPSGDKVQAVVPARLSLLSSPAGTPDDQKIKRAIADLVDQGKVIGGQGYPYSPNTTGAKNQRALLEDAMAAVAKVTAPRQWLPCDLQAVVERAISTMNAEGWLVEEQITTGRFRRLRGLQVDWPRTPWGSSPKPTVTGPSERAGMPRNKTYGRARSRMVVNWSMVWSMIDQLPKQGGGQLPPFRGALTARHPHTISISQQRSCARSGGRDAIGPLQCRHQNCMTTLSYAILHEVIGVAHDITRANRALTTLQPAHRLPDQPEHAPLGWSYFLPGAMVST